MVKAPSSVALALALTAAACVDLGGAPRTAISGRVTIGPGLVFLEKGHVQQGVFQRFGLIDEHGRFEVDVPSGGPWGVHLYFDDYFYLPLEVDVREDFVTPIQQPDIDWGIVRNGPTWGASGMQPDDANVLAPIPDDDLGDNPTLDGARVERVSEGRFQATVDIQDPNQNLSKQALLGNVETGEGIQLNPPAPPQDDNFPNGIYSATLFPPDDAGTEGAWWFVAADHGCSNSPILEARAR
jgi:hypothetical protein